MSELHSVVFLPPRWTIPKAKKWLKEHDLKPIKHVDIVKVDGVRTQLRYRIRDPKRYKKFITKKTEDDINFVIGFKK